MDEDDDKDEKDEKEEDRDEKDEKEEPHDADPAPPHEPEHKHAPVVPYPDKKQVVSCTKAICAALHVAAAHDCCVCSCALRFV